MPYKDPAKKKKKDFEYTKQWRIDNREEYLAKRREYKRKYSQTEAGRLQRRKEVLKHLYGITLEQYDEKLAEQHNCCAICGTLVPGHNHKHFSVDHDHENGKIRGLLCHYCNRGLGFLRDDIKIVENTLNYLRKYKGV